MSKDLTPAEFISLLEEKTKEIENYIDNTAPRLIGKIAVEHFQANFDREGFADIGNPSPWQDVKRRDPNSPWFGFDATAKGSGYKSPKRMKDKILHDSGELQASIDYETGKAQATIYSDKPYAQVHNEGGQAKIFGKTPFTMPKRQFIGESRELNNKIVKQLDEDITKILNKV
ncbi:MAG: phage virion morphogenesis protein [Bacteroidales bacterium]|jgi:phage gpG-like protein|nr:phage virion morphogenesis protein [Bacteroidales bacterium]